MIFLKQSIDNFELVQPKQNLARKHLTTDIKYLINETI